MDYKEAMKLVKASNKEQRCNYLQITFSYGNSVLLPHDQGVALLECMNHAEQFKSPYNENPTIVPMERDYLEVRQMSQLEYEQIKIAALLQLPLAQVKESALHL